MTDTSKENVERVICQPIIDHVSDGRTIWDEGYAQMIDLARAVVKERDALREENRELKMQIGPFGVTIFSGWDSA